MEGASLAVAEIVMKKRTSPSRIDSSVKGLESVLEPPTSEVEAPTDESLIDR